MAIVQSSGVTSGTSTSFSRTFSATPTSGRLLICAASFGTAPNTLTGPSGWTLLTSLTTGNVRAYWWYKYSDGTEGTVTVSWASSGGFGSMWIAEFDDAVSGAPITAENEASASTVVTSVSSGTATATASSGLAIAFFAADNGNNADGSRAYSNSFTERAFQYAAGSDRASVGIATLTYSATGNYSSTFSVTDTGDEMYGAVALFGSALNNYTLACDVGTFTFTGVDAGLRAARLLVADNGAFALTGNDLALARGLRLTAEVGSYTLTGIAAGLVYSQPEVVTKRYRATALNTPFTGTALPQRYSARAIPIRVTIRAR